MAAPRKPAPSRSSPSPGRRRRFFEPVNLKTSIVLVFPLLIAYQCGLLLSRDALNGADLLTGRVYVLLGNSWMHYLVFNLVLAGVFVLLLWLLRRQQAFDTRMFLPVMLESALYALAVGPIIVWTMAHLGINPKLVVEAVGGPLLAAQTGGVPVPDSPGPVDPKQLGVLARLTMSLGAGVHEELVFRLAMIPALGWLFHKAGGLSRVVSLLIAFVVSSLLFSAAHHVIGGEPWKLAPFVYRFFCGMIFATLFQFRGFAVAVYTHALYDIYVMLLR